MTWLTCPTVQRGLAAFHDQELPVEELIAIETHVQDCAACARELDELRLLAEAVRAASAPAPSEDWTGVQPSVIGRMRAEAHESIGARARRMFEDMHLVWIGLASTAATVTCGAVALSMLQFASPERTDSLREVIAVMAAPLGSDQNPTRLDRFISAPTTMPGDEMMADTLAGSSSGDELVLPLSLTVSREGRVLGVSVLNNDHDSDNVTSIVDAVSRTRLQPAQGGDGPVAVSLIWLLNHTTVRGKIRS